MSQSFTQIQQAFDAALLTVPGMTAQNIVLVTENDVSNFAMLPNSTNKIGIRSTLIVSKSTKATLGIGGFVNTKGFYQVDLFCTVNQGYATTKTLADAVINTFTPGLQLSLANGDFITIDVSTPSPNVTQGAWTMNKLYASQVLIYWFGYPQQ
jgi:hypothetical protein